MRVLVKINNNASTPSSAHPQPPVLVTARHPAIKGPVDVSSFVVSFLRFVEIAGLYGPEERYLCLLHLGWGIRLSRTRDE